MTEPTRPPVTEPTGPPVTEPTGPAATEPTGSAAAEPGPAGQAAAGQAAAGPGATGHFPGGHAIMLRAMEADPFADETAAALAEVERYELSRRFEHARAAGPEAVGEALADLAFVSSVDPALAAAQLPMTAATPGQDGGRDQADADENQAWFRQSVPALLRTAGAARWQVLMVNAARLGRAELAERLSEGASWTVRWATGSGRSAPVRQCLVLPDDADRGGAAGGATPSAIPMINIAAAGGPRPLLVAAYDIPGGPGRVVAWDMIAGTVAGELRDPSAAEPTALATLTIGGHALAAAGRADGTISIWDLAGPTPARRIRARAGRDGTVRAWNVAGPSPTLHIAAHADDADEAQRSVLALAAAVTSGGPVLVSGGRDGTVRCWNPVDGSPRASLVRQQGDAHLGPVRALAMLGGDPAATADLLVTGGDDGMLRTWELRTGSMLREWRANQAGVSSLAALADWQGKPFVLSGHADGTTAGWNPLTGEPVIAHRRISEAGLTALALHGAGRLVACSHDGTVSQADLRSPALSRLFTAHGESRIGLAVARIARLNDQDYVACGGSDGAIWIWDLNAAPVRSRRRGDPGTVAAVWTGPGADGGQVVSAGLDGSITIRDHATGDQRRLDPLRADLRRPRLLAVTLTPAGQPALACVGDDAVIVHGPRAGSACPLPVDARDVTAVTLAPRGGKLVAALAFREPGRAPEIFAVGDGMARRLAYLRLPDPTDPPTAIAAAPAGAATAGAAAALLACVHASGRITVWEIRPGRAPRLLAEGDGAPAAVCASLAAAGDELLLAVGTPDRSVELRDLRHRRPPSYLSCAEPVRAVAADPAGGVIIGQGQDVIALRSLTC